MKCAICGKASSSSEHCATLHERCVLDDKTFKALESILDMRSCAKDEMDSAGNPIVCRSCTRSALEKAKSKVAERRR